MLSEPPSSEGEDGLAGVGGNSVRPRKRSDTLRLPQRGKRIIIILEQQFSKIRPAVKHRTYGHQAVVLAGKVRPYARPRPFLRTRNKPYVPALCGGRIVICVPTAIRIWHVSSWHFRWWLLRPRNPANALWKFHCEEGTRGSMIRRCRSLSGTTGKLGPSKQHGPTLSPSRERDFAESIGTDSLPGVSIFTRRNFLCLSIACVC